MAATDHGDDTVEQVVAANVDAVFLTPGLDGDFNARRLERYLTLGWESGAGPVVVLTKTDLCDDVEAALLEVEVGRDRRAGPRRSATSPARASTRSPRTSREGRTVAALGSSGVGKSSLVNRLAGEELMATGDLRADGRGRHTTTHRQLLLLPGGGLFLDTPGNAGAAALGVGGGARDRIRRRGRGGGAVPLRRLLARAPSRTAACGPRSTTGTLDRERYDSWRKLQSELRWLEVKQDARLRSEARKEWRRFARSQRKASW